MVNKNNKRTYTQAYKPMVSAYKRPRPIIRKMNPRTGGYIGLEKKFIDYVKTDAVLTQVWTTGVHNPASTGLSTVAQGDGESSRDGRRYDIHSVQVTGRIATTVQEGITGPPADILVRIALVLDKQTNGAELKAENVFTVGANPDTDSYRNLQFISRFQVLKEKKIRIPVAQSTVAEGVDLFSTGQVKVPFKFSYKWRKAPLKITTNGTTAVIGAVTDNSLHIICVADDVTIVPLLSYSSRVRFTG